MIPKTYPRGSEWRKWDLHLHSPDSYVSNFKGWDNYIKEVNKTTKEKDIKVLGITDYFAVDGYEKIISEYSSALENVDLILPNIEFRLDTTVYVRGNTKPRRLNFHVIFSDKVPISIIKSQFLGELHFLKGSGSAGFLQKIKLDKSAIEAYGAECKKSADHSGESDLEVGTRFVLFDFSEIVETLRKKDDFLDNYVLILDSAFWSDIDWAQDYGIRKTLLQVSHGVFCSNPKDIAWFLGKDKTNYSSQDSFIGEFGRLFPCIHGSDAHSIEQLKSRPDLDRYCWIKADPTFEGLKQIFCEPEERVFIGPTIVKSKNDAVVIDRIVIDKSNHWFEEKPLLLNDNLLAIIGEKGAGKTAIADFIALAGGDYDTAGNDIGSFVRKALRSTKQIVETIEDCIVSIHWRDGSTNEIKITKGLDEYQHTKKVRYLSQSFIERKCHHDKAEELQKEIEEIIFQHIPSQDRLDQTTFVNLKTLKTRSIEVKKKDTQKQIETLNKHIYDLEVEIDSLQSKKEERDKLKLEIEQLTRQKPRPQTAEEKRIEEGLALLSARIETLDGQIAEVNKGLNIIETIRTEVASLQSFASERLADIKKNLDSIGLSSLLAYVNISIAQDFFKALEKHQEELETKVADLKGHPAKPLTSEDAVEGKGATLGALTPESISKLNIIQLSELVSELESKSSIAETARTTIKAFDAKIAKNAKRTEELEKNISDIETVMIPSLPETKAKRDKSFESYFLLLQEEKKILEEIYSPLRQKLDQDSPREKSQINFFARIELDTQGFFNHADNIIDFTKKGTYRQGKELLLKEIKSIAEKIEIGEESDVLSIIKHLYDSFEISDMEPFDLASQLLRGKKKMDFYNWIFDVSNFRVTYSIKYQGTNIELLSPGKKGIVLLLMYLALDTESSVPLVIDQPEENLDNKSLYNHLVDYFKVAKKRRQIIIVTHNPNLVLNTDAEQIIVANFEAVPSTYKSRITYMSGSIENSYINKALELPLLQQGIREHGADILEGGKTAFIRRKKRYEY